MFCLHCSHVELMHADMCPHCIAYKQVHGLSCCMHLSDMTKLCTVCPKHIWVLAQLNTIPNILGWLKPLQQLVFLTFTSSIQDSSRVQTRGGM